MNYRFAFILSIICFSCSDSKYYKIQFDKVERLSTGDFVLVKDSTIGQITKIKLDETNKIIATIRIDEKIKITKGSKFSLVSGLMGSQYIQIELSDDQQLIDPEEIQFGVIRPMDTTGFRKISQQELDSLLRTNPNFALTDSITDSLIKVLKVVHKNLGQKKNKNN